MKTKSSIGFHVGPGGNKGGIGQWMESAYGQRSSIKSVDDYGICLEALGKGVPYVGFRITKASGSIPEEVPDYTLSPREAAERYLLTYMAALPPEFDKNTWLELINEPRTILNPGDVQYNNMNPVDWLGQFMYECAILLNPQGYKICGPSFNSGEPPEDSYNQIGMVEYLEYCANNPEKAALALHEYNWNWSENWDDVIPHLWGRFERWIAMTDAANIPRDYHIFVTEWGGSHNWAHDWSWIKRWLDKYNELIAPFPQVKMCASWTMQSGWGDIDDQVNSWMQAFMNGEYEDEFEMGEQPHPTFLGTLPGQGLTTEEKIFNLSQSWAFPVNEDAALQAKGLADGYTPSGEERWHVVDDVNYAMQPFYQIGNTNSKRSYYAVVGDWGNVKYTDGSGSDDPLAGIHMGQPFPFRWMITSLFDAPRSYSNGKHEGVDVDILGGLVDNTVDVLALYPGTVFRVVNSSGGYGMYVVVDHVYQGTPFQTWYCHLDDFSVSVGQSVTIGTPIGEVGTTGNVTGEHAHVNLVIPGYGAPPEDGYAIDWVVDPLPYLPDPASLPIYGEDNGELVDMSPYFLPSGQYGAIVIISNNWGEGNERQQLQRDGQVSYITKNQQYEEREVGDTRVWFRLDTSPDGVQYYRVDSEDGWCPRRWKPGDSFIRSEIVDYYTKSNCQFQSRTEWTSQIVFGALHSSWTSKAGINFSDVIELRWVLGGVVEEWYSYAPGYGLVGWRNRHGRESWASELPQGQDNNVREIIDCL